jgi:hypothetical protein
MKTFIHVGEAHPIPRQLKHSLQNLNRVSLECKADLAFAITQIGAQAVNFELLHRSPEDGEPLHVLLEFAVRSVR